jgi:hypothetical protein
MKKLILGIAALGLLALVSCNKESEQSTPDEPGSCTLTGNVWAALNLSNDTTDAGEFIAGLKNEEVDGVNITFILNSGDLDHNPDPDFDYKDLSFTTTVEDGLYSISLPAITTPLSVKVLLDDFVEDQRQFVPGDVVFETKTFSQGIIEVDGLSQGVTRVRDFTYEYE